MRASRVEALVLLACGMAAVALTWPMAAHFTTRLGGDPGDPFQTLWSTRWMHDALVSLRNPFFTDRVFHPHGATLVFETFDTPTALLSVPLWWVFPPFGVYNAGVLFAFTLSAYGLYRLARELTGDTLASAAAGIVFTAAPYHLAHVQGHQHLISMGWLPLYLVHLHRMVEGRARWRDPILGGLFLGLATLSSFYHLLYALVFTPVIFAGAAIRFRRAFVSRMFLAQALALAATFLAVAGPLIVAVLLARAREPIVGSHDPVRFSGDLEAFFFPNLAHGWSHLFGGHAFRWTGNAAETALYAGYTVLLAAILGALIAGGVARTYLVIAVIGAVLALGPHPHVGGQVFPEIRLPYFYLEKALPLLTFMGVPVRLGYNLYLGLSVGFAVAIAKVRERLSRPLLRVLAAVIPTALALVEYAPRPFIETEAHAPKPMLSWREDPTPFAVLDISDDYRMMFHATIHGKPMIGGNLTRVSKRLDDGYWGLPIVQGLRRPRAVEREALSRIDPVVDFDWKGGAPEGLRGDRFRVTWTGAVRVPIDGYWTFFLGSDDGSVLTVDGRTVLDNSGVHPMREGLVHLRLRAGTHPLSLSYEEVAGGASVRLEWEGPGVPRQVVPAGALLTPQGEPGLSGVYRQVQETGGMTRAEGRAALRALGVRFVITGLWDSDPLELELELPRVYEGEGVRIYEVD